MSARGLVRLLLLGLGSSIVPLDTAVNIAFPQLTDRFHLPLAMIQWVVISYVLTYASLLLAFGRIGDIFGHSRVFCAGLLWSAIALLLCGAAPNYGFLLFFRFLQGIGAGLVISCAPALVTGLYPEERRGRALGAFWVMFALASALGPLLGGALLALWGWPAVFWFRAPLALLSLLFLARAPVPQRRLAQPLDVPGALLFAALVSASLLVLNERRPLSAFVLLTAAALSLYGFILRERRASHPIVDLGLFRNLPFLLLNLASVAVNLAAFSVLLFVPYYLDRVARLPHPAAGAVLAASFLGTILSSPLGGILIERIAVPRLAALGAALTGAGLFAIAGSKPSLSFAALPLLVSLLLQGFGLGLFQVAYTAAVMETLPRGDRGVAGGLAMLTRTLGIVGGATLLSLAFHGIESLSLARGAGAPESFLAAFRAVFRLAGLVSTAGAALTLLRGRAR